MSGDCYKAAANYLLEQASGDCFLVHAEVIGQGQLAGIAYGHAFVECGNMVFDYSNGRAIVLPKLIYYGLGKIDANTFFDPNQGMVEREPKIYKYNRQEMLSRLSEAGHWGPWELETDSGY